MIENNIKRTFNTNLFLSLLFIIIGLFLFIKPDTTVSIISYTIGLILIVNGLIEVYRYIKENDIYNIFSFRLSYGVLLIIAGIFMFIKPNLLSSLFPIILGVWIIINSINKFQYSLILKKSNNKDYLYTILISILSFIWGIILLCNPFKSALVITQTIGIFIIIYAVLDIMENLLIRKNITDIIEVFK